MKTLIASLIAVCILSCNNQTPKVLENTPKIQQDTSEIDSVPLKYEEMIQQLKMEDSSHWISVNDLLKSLHPKNKKAQTSYIKNLNGEELLESYSQFYKMLNSIEFQNDNPAFRKVYILLDNHLEFLNTQKEISTENLLKITSIRSDINTWFANSKINKF